MKTQDKRKGLQVAGNIEPANIDQYRSLAVEARRGLHEFATDVLNLIVECSRSEQKDWDAFKVNLPGYQHAMSERRRRAVVEALTAPPTVKERYDSLPVEAREELEAKLREIDARKKPTKSKSKAS